MREVFQQSLDEVRERLVEISGLVGEAIEKATTAFGTSDVALAEEVIDNDTIIDEKAVALDELAIDILARQQPVATDLRMVVSALRISASLERMGDIAEHIAQLTRMRFPDRAIPKGLKSTFTKMGEIDVDPEVEDAAHGAPGVRVHRPHEGVPDHADTQRRTAHQQPPSVESGAAHAAIRIRPCIPVILEVPLPPVNRFSVFDAA